VKAPRDADIQERIFKGRRREVGLRKLEEPPREGRC
jgi:hypothetical protein